MVCCRDEIVTSLYLCADEIADAVAGGRPVVALETTVVTHGLPHPDGVAAALALENEIRQCGAIPATIGILRGAIRVGLTSADLNELATSPENLLVDPRLTPLRSEPRFVALTRTLDGE